MKIFLDLMVDPDAAAAFRPVDLGVADDATAADVVAALRETCQDRITAATDVGILASDLCTIYVQVVGDDGLVTSRAEW